MVYDCWIGDEIHWQIQVCEWWKLICLPPTLIHTKFFSTQIANSVHNKQMKGSASSYHSALKVYIFAYVHTN